MPNIREYNAPEGLALKPNDAGVDAAANAARRAGAIFNQVGSETQAVGAQTGRNIASTINDVGDVAVKYATNREISSGSAAFTGAFAKLDSDWNSTIRQADPNNPAIGAQFLEKSIEPTLEKLRENFMTEGGQRFAESKIDMLRSHFVNKISGDMSEMAGIAARANVQTVTNQLSNAASNDPSSLSTALKLLEGSVGSIVDSSPTIRPGDSARLKADVLLAAQSAVVKAAAIGAIARNPEAGLAKFSSPEYSKYISGAELRQLEQQSKAVKRAERVDETYARTLDDRKQRIASDAREGEYLQRLFSGDPTVAATVTAKDIASDLTLSREARQRMIGVVERETKPEAASKISNSTATDLISRIRLPAGDPERITDLNPIYDAYEKGKLNKSDLKFVRDEFANLRTPEGEALGHRQSDFINSVKPMIDKSNPLMGRVDQSGHQQLYRFTVDLQRKIAEYKKAGKDPYSLMDPQSPDYMGAPAALAGYQKPIQESLRDAAAAIRGNTNLTAPGNRIVGVTVESAPVATSAPKSAAPPPPKKGEVRGGYEFLGGNPGDPRSYRKVSE